MTDLLRLRKDIETEAKHLGFQHVGVASAFPAPHYKDFCEWIENNYHGTMGYLAREDTLAKRGDPQLILEGCQRILSLAFPYSPPQSGLSPAPRGVGRISTYATTADYHQILWEKLAKLEAFIRKQVDEHCKLKSYADTGPVLERSFAAQSGIGSAGKNSNLIIQGYGSYFFLAEILTDLPLPVDDPPFTRDLCGTCQRCVDACPTNCILPNRTIDASRCISYLTIEHKGIIQDELKALMGTWLFGCDVCQIICPHNSQQRPADQAVGERVLPEMLELEPLFALDDHSFKTKFGQTPLARAKRDGILRNAAIILGNQRCASALPALKNALESESDPGLQDACRWAIHQIEAS
jgi:epoxyqueuosine reductase